MVDANYILAPQIVKVSFALSPALNAVESIREINEVERLSGFHDWVTQTAAAIPQERRDLNLMIFEGLPTLFFDVMPPMPYPDFPSYVDAIAARDPVQLRDAVLESGILLCEFHSETDRALAAALSKESLLNDEALFIRFVRVLHAEEAPERLWHEVFGLLNDPLRLQATVTEHLRWMWDHFVAEEWQRVRPMLEESVAAFAGMDFGSMTAYEAIRAVTTRDLRGKFDEKLDDVDSIVFVPSAHVGPYVVKIKIGTTFSMIFGARLPRGVQGTSSSLSRSELLTRLNALADDTRLRILELLTRHEELCAQDIIEILGLSQSSVSRHLSQLSANGFVVERRREAAKCYSLNTDRFVDTLRTLTNFLSRQ